ncbi:MAG TPA: hypothetical protein VHM20_05060, partial [Gammaproteobacteria bacterium]|nr:hypothetical protein [Gammaproteobacteria bacterium]
RMLMMPLPIKALTFDQIEFLNIKAEVSGNGAEKIYVLNPDGTKQRGYFKRCTPTKYPPLLAKYVIAASIFIRAAIGDRASEERLVFDKKNNIIGTVSFTLPDFIPLRTYLSSPYLNPKHEYYGVPDKKLLIETNVAELLFSAYRHLNNDLHPANISLNGLIDWDETYFTLTSIIKYGRQQIIKLSKEEILRFPNITFGSRKHWTTYFIPKNGNILKIYNTNAFGELEKDPEFIQQKFHAILKELLAYDPSMIKERLKCYLGDISLKLHDLSKDKLELFLNYDKQLIEKRMHEDRVQYSSTEEYLKIYMQYQKKYSIFFDDNNKELSFVNHIERYFEEEHQELLQIMINMEEFREYLIEANRHPKVIQNIKQWFKLQNKNHADIPYNLCYINQLYHYIWRESFKKTIEGECKAIEKHIQSFCRSENSVETFEYRLSKIRIPSPHKRDARLGIADSIVLVEKPKKNESKHTIADIYYREIKNEEKKFFRELHQLKDQYYTKSELLLKDNHEFIVKVEKLIENAMITRKAKKDWLLKNKESLKNANNIGGPIDDLILDMQDFYRELNKLSLSLLANLKQFKINELTTFKTDSPSPISIVKETKDLPLYSPKLYSSRTEMELKGFKRLALPPPTPAMPSPDTPTPHSSIPDPTDEDFQLVFSYPKIIPDTISKRLKPWIEKNRFEVQAIIKETYLTKYNSYFNYFKTHGPETIHQSLEKILSTGKWTSTSLNCLLIKELTLAMLTSNNEKDESEQFLFDSVKDKDNYWWSNIAEEI